MTHYQALNVTCPNCNHEYTTDDMLDCKTDLYALAPNEETAVIECPVCDSQFAVKGGYRPHYSTALAEELLD